MSRIKKIDEFLNQKEKCGCDSVAVWLYMPSSEGGYYCENCVPRGCSCNDFHSKPEHYHPNDGTADVPEGVEGKDWKWKEDGVFVYLDDQGRESPCCEYMYNENGFDKD